MDMQQNEQQRVVGAGPKSRAAVKSRSHKRKLVSDSDDESDGAAAAAESDSDFSGSEFGPADAGPSSDSDEVRSSLQLTPVILLCTPRCHTLPVHARS